MIVMKMESSLNPAASNPYSNATGLIQFMPATAAGLGTSVQALKTMSNTDQLDYVYKYFQPYSGRLHSVEDLYTVTFFPRALGQPDSYVLQTDSIAAGTIAAQNQAYDIDRNQSITAGELRASILKGIPSDVRIFAETATDYVVKK